MRTHNYLYVKENRKAIPIKFSDLVLLLTLISPNYPSLEHIFMVTMVFEPVKLYLYLHSV